MNQNFQNRNTFRCPNCGAPVNGPFCTNCGQHFAYSPYKKNKTATNYIISFVGLILFILKSPSSLQSILLLNPSYGISFRVTL